MTNKIKYTPLIVYAVMQHQLFKILTITFSICLSFFANAQLIEHTASFRNINHDKYFRFHYDNDFFTKSDKYYSQGITLEFVHPGIKKFPLTKLLWKPYINKPQYGVTFNLFGYTPTSILSDAILVADRPFNANISVKTFLMQTDAVHQQQFSSAFSFGVMGPAALGNQIQTNIHRWLKNPLPHGWQYQIKNDLILNYQINYEKRLPGSGKHFLWNSSSELRLGTLNNKVNTGFNFMAGNFNNRFKPDAVKKKISYYLYCQNRLNLIGYDASLQGGLLNRKSPYTIKGKDVTRVTYQADAGIVVQYKKLLLSYTQSLLTKEFQKGKTHRWGGISLGIAL